jgi:hypothetical protein
MPGAGGDGARRDRGEPRHCVTSLPATTGPVALRTGARGPGGIEHRRQDVRDVTFGEDARRVRRGAAPPVRAARRAIAGRRAALALVGLSLP